MMQIPIGSQPPESGKVCCGGGACGKPSLLSVLSLPLRLALGVLFLFAAYNKLFVENGPSLFAASIKAFKVIDPVDHAKVFQLAVFVTPWVEIVAGLALVLGLWTRAAAGVLAGLLLVFIALIASVLHRELDTECGCFGKLSPFCPAKISNCNIYQNVVLLAMAGLIMWSPKHYLSMDSELCGKRGCRR
ncbi:MAG: DoxX family protein [Pyrinomonadaceae bacterium]|nr:DoxX family protein [Phycisphaerales bacterium]